MWIKRWDKTKNNSTGKLNITKCPRGFIITTNKGNINIDNGEQVATYTLDLFLQKKTKYFILIQLAFRVMIFHFNIYQNQSLFKNIKIKILTLSYVEHNADSFSN